MLKHPMKISSMVWAWLLDHDVSLSFPLYGNNSWRRSGTKFFDHGARHEPTWKEESNFPCICQELHPSFGLHAWWRSTKKSWAFVPPSKECTGDMDHRFPVELHKPICRLRTHRGTLNIELVINNTLLDGCTKELCSTIKKHQASRPPDSQGRPFYLGIEANFVWTVGQTSTAATWSIT